MGRGFRMAIALFCILSAVGFIAIQFSIPAGVEGTPNGRIWVFIAFLLLIAVVCFESPLRGIAARIVGAMVFTGCLGFLVSEIRNPTPVATGAQDGKESLLYSIMAFIMFGAPCAYLAFTGRYPKWRYLGTSVRKKSGNPPGRRF